MILASIFEQVIEFRAQVVIRFVLVRVLLVLCIAFVAKQVCQMRFGGIASIFRYRRKSVCIRLEIFAEVASFLGDWWIRTIVIALPLLVRIKVNAHSATVQYFKTCRAAGVATDGQWDVIE